MRSARIPALTAAVVLAATALSACGGGAGSDPDTVKVAYNRNTDNKVRFKDNFLSSMKKQFEKAHPGKKIELVPIQAPDNDYAAKVQQMMRSPRTAPDLVYEDTFRINADIKAGYLQPLDDRLAKWDTWDQFADTARGLGVEILVIAVDGPDGFDDFFAAARRAGADAVLVAPLPWLPPHFMRLGELVAQSRFPAIGPSRLFAEGGGLFSYGQKQGESGSRFAAQVDKLLKGAKPADVPVEQQMRFDFVINLKTAKALGLTIPSTVLFQADEVIQ